MGTCPLTSLLMTWRIRWTALSSLQMILGTPISSPESSAVIEGTKQHGGMDQYEPLKFNNIKFCTYEEPFVIIQSQDLMA